MSTNTTQIEKREWTSSMIKSTSYNWAEATLSVKFTNDVEYTYENVNATEYENFANAESQGKHFISSIRNQKTYRKND